MVPISLTDESTEEVIWKNVRTSSTRFCRPIRLQWLHETSDVSKSEEMYIQKQIDELQPYVNDNCTVKFSLLLTMIDGKVTKL